MTALRRHVIAVVAALFALSVGIALGGGPLSYVSDDDTVSPSEESGPDDEGSESPGAAPEPAADGFAEAFAAAAAVRLYDEALLGHPTAIVAMPGADPGLVEAMAAQVPLAGGGLTGVFEVTDRVVDRDETSLVDTLGSQLLTELDDTRIDPDASTYVRLGQLLSLAIATQAKDGGQRPDTAAQIVRSSLAAGGLLTGSADARLAPLVLVLLPDSGEQDPEDVLAATAIYAGLTTGLRVNAAGVVLLGDTTSGEDGLLAGLREDDLVTSTLATVDGGDTVLGQVTAMLAVISALDGSVGAYGASGSDGAIPIS